METKPITLTVVVGAMAAIGLIEIGGAGVAANLSIAPIAIIGGMRLLEMLCILNIVSWRGGDIARIGLKGSWILTGMIKGAVWSAGVGAFVGIAFIVMRHKGLTPASMLKGSLPDTGLEMMLFLLVGGLIGPVAEEIFFRGILYSFFRKWGMVTAMLVSTLMFVLCHPTAGRLPVTQIAGSVLFALAFEFEKNLMVPITIHVIGNMAIYGILYLT